MRLTAFLLIVSLFANCGGKTSDVKMPHLKADMTNRYQLTTEERFAADYPAIRANFARGQDVSFESDHDKLRINARAFAGSMPGKGAIVISSGRTEGMVVYQELIYDLQKQGYAVYILDHRGQGASERIYKPDPERGYVEKFDYYVDDLNKFVETVVKPHHPARETRFLLAHSMGGAIASLYLEKHSGNFAAAALVTPMHEPILLSQKMTRSVAWINRLIPGWASTGYAVRQRGYEPPDAFEKNVITHSKIRYEKMIEVYRENNTMRLGGPTHGWIREAYRGGQEARDGAKGIKVPVLLLQGSGDTVVSADAQKEFWEGVNSGGGCSKAYVVDKAAHAVFNEADTFRIPALTAVLDFFDHPPSATASACAVWQPFAGPSGS
jgi:lysophospholipase